MVAPQTGRAAAMLCVAVALVAGACTVASPGLAMADEGEPLVEVSEGQLDLNDRGIESIVEGEFERAIRLFEASLELGRINVTYANLGRAHQLAGMCEEADAAYETALVDAPQAKEPTPDQIEGAIEAYREELSETCPGHVAVECTPSEVDLFFDGEGPKECSEPQRFEVMPGTYEVRGEFRGYEVTYRLAVEALKEE